MNKLLAFTVSAFLLYSCQKDKQPDTKCTVNHIPLDYQKQSNALIPVNTRNFWTYTDSIFNGNTGALDTVTATQINIEDVYQVDGLTYFDFTELLPAMTLVDDTLFTVATGAAGNSCYTLKKKLFPVKDTTEIGEAYSQKLYNDTATIHTAAGDFAGNTVYKDGDAMKMYFHAGAGLIRVEIRLGNGTLRRSLTLKDYRVR